MIQSDENQTLKTIKITMDDVNEVINEIYKSKTADIIQKVPRQHVILLKTIEQIFDEQNSQKVGETKLLNEYNKRACELMIGRIRLADLRDMVQTLCNFDIL